MGSSGRELRTMPASEFVRRMKESVEDSDRHYVLWLGAGCSVTAGIPAAGALVREHWLSRLQWLRGGSGDVEAWAATALDGYDREDPAASYGTLMGELFVNPEERQRETERLCDGSVPGFAYAVLAALMSADGGAFGTVLTTNFDDLVADAMYVFGKRRPLVIQHESLASFVRPGRVRRPLVVKLHGDHRLNPMHTAAETLRLKDAVATGATRLLHDRGVVFIGYSGNDRGVIEMLGKLPADALPLGVWWVARREPTGAIRRWLEARDAVWVKADDFDKLMLLFREEFGIAHPTAGKFERMVSGYRETYERLSSAVDKLPDSDVDSGALKQAVRRASEAAPTWWGIVREAQRIEETDPERAEAIYERGIAQVESAELLGSYANFLTRVGLDHDRAEALYARSLALAPDKLSTLLNYGVFLADVRDDLGGAEKLYERALALAPDDANLLGNYAIVLGEGGEIERAEQLYRRALALSPSHANNLSNYAVFLMHHREDWAGAQQAFERALALDPDDPNILANYAGLLLELGEEERAFELVERAFEHATLVHRDTVLELWFYLAALGPPERRADALAQIRELLGHGIRVARSDLSGILARVRERGGDDAEWIERLARVLTARDDPEVLRDWPDWPGD